MMRQPGSPFWRDTRGAAAAEMVLMMPLLLVLIFTTFEAAHFLWSEHKVVKGVRDGARYAGRLAFTNFNCGTGQFTGDASPIQNLTRTGQLTGGVAKVPGWENGDITISVSCAAATGGLYASNANNAPRVNVSASVDYPSLFGLLGFDTTSIKLNAFAQSPVVGL
jgi:Flp pilus assembly protein TadG